MSSQSDLDHGRPHRAIRLRFSLLALFLFVTLVCVLLAWWVQPRRYIVESLFHISANQPVAFAETPSVFDPQEFERLHTTHGELIRSEFVLLSALRDPTIAALPMLRSQANPVNWLREQLEVQTSGDSELISIRMSCAEGATNDCKQIVDAVAQAYLKEVVFEDEQRQLVERDALSRSVERLQKVLVEKISAVQAAKEEAGSQQAANQVAQLEIDAMSEILRKLLVQLEISDVNSVAPSRVRRIQNAISRPE